MDRREVSAASAAHRRPPPISSASRTASTPFTDERRQSRPERCSRITLFTAWSSRGDGDTASIGLGQFMHMLRRNVPLMYIIENNGVYGLTKGQFSATADIGLEAEDRRDQPVDADRLLPRGNRIGRDTCCAVVLRRQAAAVGDPESVRSRTKDCRSIDVISPCTTFNDHEGSTKSYAIHEGSRGAAAYEVDFVAVLRGHCGRDTKRERRGK